jgi:pimeloyl-ACP methyl ester carboxylesterase
MPTTAGGTNYTLRTFRTTTSNESAHWFMDDARLDEKNIPVIIYCHGHEGPYNQFATMGAWKGLRDWLVDNGFAVVESAGGGPSSWANSAARTSYVDAFNHVDGSISVGKVIPLGRSMGGLVSYWLATQSPLASRVPALIVNSGTTDLSKRVTFNSTEFGHPELRAAYPEAKSIAEWYQLTAPHDPMQFDASLWAGKSVLQLWGTNDPSVPSSWNGEAWVAKYGTHAAYAAIDVREGGDHSAENGSYLQVSAMTTFLEFVNRVQAPEITDVYKIQNMYLVGPDGNLHEMQPG